MASIARLPQDSGEMTIDRNDFGGGSASNRRVALQAFAKYGDQAASTRQRLIQFAPFLAECGLDLSVEPLLPNSALQRLYRTRRRSPLGLARAYSSRLRSVVQIDPDNALWIYCELFPYMPGWAERISFRSGAPVIYDFDDAIFHQYDAHPNPLIRRALGRKLEALLKGSDLAICGNAYLQAYAARFCRRTELVPTVVDTEVYRPANRAGTGGTTLGWIGSPSTWTYVRPVLPVLDQLAAECGLNAVAIGAGPDAERSASLTHVAWSAESEVEMLQGMDIGIMPLPDEQWARGKCGYKLIQYMACGLPVIASPVGVNAEIVEHGVNGFLATSEAEWAEAIRQLASDPQLRQRMGAAGRRRVEERYSLHVHGPRVARMVRDVVDRARRN